MITNKKMLHILEVSRKMYTQAIQAGLSEETARKYFLVGFLHDIGYEWGDNKSHPQIAAELLEPYLPEKMLLAIQTHGDPDFPLNKISCALNVADMTTNAEGKSVSFIERLNDIGSRYGFDSEQYLLAEKMIATIKSVDNFDDLAE